MVVQYPSGSEGSWVNFLVVTPRVILWWTGSVVPSLAPQLAITVAIALAAMHLERDGALDDIHDIGDSFGSVGVLLAFLIVFKTQTAYNQFWQATYHVDALLQVSRALAMAAVTLFKDVPHLDVRQESRRIVRLLALHYFVALEYFQRTGQNAISSDAAKDRLRHDIKGLTGQAEFKVLYPGDDYASTTGSKSKHKHTNPTMVLLWVQSILGRVLHSDACPAPIISSLQRYLSDLMGHFFNMNKIDKTQFPLPYQQIVKLVTLVYVFLHPIMIVHRSGTLTPFVSAIVATGFFGLSEVAEVLESPFGIDPNDINLREYGLRLLSDLSMIHNYHSVKLDTVFPCEDEFDLASAVSNDRAPSFLSRAYRQSSQFTQSVVGPKHASSKSSDAWIDTSQMSGVSGLTLA